MNVSRNRALGEKKKLELGRGAGRGGAGRDKCSPGEKKNWIGNFQPHIWVPNCSESDECFKESCPRWEKKLELGRGAGRGGAGRGKWSPGEKKKLEW